MRRRDFIAGLLLAASVPGARAQQAGRAFRVGFLTAYSATTDAPIFEAFRQGMRELGYVEGENLTIEWRWAQGESAKFTTNTAELVRLAGLNHARGLGISQVVPYPYQPRLAAVREFHRLMKQYAPGEEVNYTNFEEFLGAKVLVEALRRAGPKPTRAAVIRALESMNAHDLGGITVGFSKNNRIGSRYVEVTVIGSTGKLLK